MKLDRDLYKEIKKMNREEMHKFLGILYSDAYKSGSEISSNTDFRIRLNQVLDNTVGIGPKLKERIIKTEKGLE